MDLGGGMPGAIVAKPKSPLCVFGLRGAMPGAWAVISVVRQNARAVVVGQLVVVRAGPKGTGISLLKFEKTMDFFSLTGFPGSGKQVLVVKKNTNK